MKYPKFRGVRNILEGEADDWLNQESVHRGLGTLYAVLLPGLYNCRLK